MRTEERSMNIVILRGVLTRPAEQRVLPSGDTLVAYEVRITNDAGPAESVPVVWSAPAGRGLLDAGDAVVVTGRVRRRFYRAGGATQSRTEVVADAVVRATDGRRVRRAVEHALAAASP
jgi:single-strand DNA-binding protein